MPDTPLSALDPREQKQADAARKAVDKNPAYAIDVCTGLLARHPGCLEVRQLLRAAQRRAAGLKGGGGMTKFFLSVSNAPFVLSGAGQVKKDPAKALETAEKLLAGNPANVAGHKLLAQAAEALGFPATAVFAWESVRDLDPERPEHLLALGRAYLAAGRPADAVRAADQVLRRDPGHGDAQALAKDAAVAISMEQGRWQEEGDFRGKLKDEAEAVVLEQAARSVNDEEALRQLVQRAQKAAEAEPANVNHPRELSGLLRQLGDLDGALAWMQRARALPAGAADAALERAEGELRVAILERDLGVATRAAEAAPGDAALAARRDTLAGQLAAFRLERAAALVEKYPTDHAFRLEYGEQLLAAGQHDAAARQFQQALRGPKVRLAAMLRLAHVFRLGGKLDLAADQLELAKQELPAGDERRLEVLYELGRCREALGQKERAIAEFKAIYAVDLGYKDVAARIDAAYRGS